MTKGCTMMWTWILSSNLGLEYITEAAKIVIDMASVWLCDCFQAAADLCMRAWSHFLPHLSAWDSVKIEIECNFGWVQKKPLVSVWTLYFVFLMEPPVQSWDQFFEFLKPSVLVMFTKNFELVQFKTSLGSICITYNFIFWKNCVILIMCN